LSLVEQIGLRDRLLPSDDRARRRFIYTRGQLREVPTGPLSFLTSDVVSARCRARMMLEPFIRGGSRPDESIHQFASRRLGREAADVLVDAAITGIFGGSSHELSVRACFPRLWQMEHDAGSIVRSMVRRRPRSNAAASRGGSVGRLVSFADGIETLTKALATSAGKSLRLNASVVSVGRKAMSGRTEWHVTLADGSSMAAEHLIIATGARAAGAILTGRDPELAALLDGIRMAPIAVVCLGFADAAADARLDGFGFLVPGQERARILGAVWDSSIFSDRAPAGHTLIRVLVGGGRDPDAVSLDDAGLVARVLDDLGRMYKVQSSPAFVRVIRQVPGLPQYVVGHLDRLARIESCLLRHEGLRLTGNSYRGLALNACIETATSLAMELLSPTAAR
jgi:oxygen-dependent protoporphyrinogen oxidase